jgi:type 1 fimbriae regulatory protein FimB/type 1 fimbriae regulatory protein FimE
MKNKPAERAAPPRKPKDNTVRGRKHLTEEEVERLIRAARGLGRYGHRDATMILVAFRHGYRVRELVRVRRDQVDLGRQTILVERSKGSRSNVQDLSEREVTALKKILKSHSGPYVFPNERRDAKRLSERAFFKILARAGEAAELGIAVHPHMLRHACGFHIINSGKSTRVAQDRLGHKNIRHTEEYTRLAPDKAIKIWED